MTAASNPATAGRVVTLTATVTSATAGTITGTVTFFDGGTSIGTGSVGAGGVATLMTSTLAAGIAFDHGVVWGRCEFWGRLRRRVDAVGERGGEGEHDHNGSFVVESVDGGRECDVYGDGDFCDGGDDYRDGDVL